MRKLLTLVAFLLIGIIGFAQQYEYKPMNGLEQKVVERKVKSDLDKTILQEKEVKKIEGDQYHSLVPSTTNQKGKATLNEGFDDVTFPPPWAGPERS